MEGAVTRVGWGWPGHRHCENQRPPEQAAMACGGQPVGTESSSAVGWSCRTGDRRRPEGWLELCSRLELCVRKEKGWGAAIVA